MRRAQCCRFHWNPFWFLLAVLVMSTPLRLAAQQPQIAGQGGVTPPRAIAGPNQKIGVHPGALAQPTLDGSQSFDSDPNHYITSFQWKDQGGNVIGNGPTVHLVLGYTGTYTYALTVCDDQQPPACSSNSTTVEVVIDLRPPAVDAPDITVSVTDPGSATVSKSTSLSNYVLNGATTSAVDDVDPAPHFLKVVANNATVTSSTVFPEGDTPILVFYTDQAGNLGSSPATVHVVDRQDNDIFVQSGEGNCFATPCNDAIQRIRGGTVTHFCTLAGGSTIAGFGGVILDSSGRVVSMRMAPNIAGSSGLEIVRCTATNAAPEPFAFIRNFGPLPAGYNEPFPTLRAANGGGLHLARLRTLVIDDNQNNGNPFVVNEDAYVFDLVTPPTTVFGNDFGNVSKMYHVKQDFWEDGPQLGPVLGSGNFTGSNPVGMYFHSGTTYVAYGGCLDRTKIPLTIRATGTAGGVSFNLSLGLFGSSGEFCNWVLDNLSGPHVTACNGKTIPGDGSGFSIMDGFYRVLFDDSGGNALTLISNSGATGASFGVLTNFSELPFDDPSNPGNFFPNPFNSCAPTAKVTYVPLPTPSGFGFWGPDFVASTPNGLVGTSRFSQGGIVFGMVPGNMITIATGVEFVGGIAAWPPNVSAGATLSVLIRIESPVDVLVTDPNGKKLGMQNGVPVNDFGNDGFDSGAGTHPRFYAINNPVPGDFTVQSIGTGTGPYTVHVYSIDTSKPFGQHIFSSGNASPGVLSNQNFTLGANADIVFTNHAPTANAGPDQTVNAAANGNATVNLDGSFSSDPDGDTLTYTWAGPFGLANGAQPQVTLPVGVNVLTLTVDDGKGGSASSSVTITVNASADTTPPVLTLPANMTVEATSPAGAVVNYSATANDAVDGPITPVCAPASGGTFPLGQTTVNCTATDLSNNSSNGSFTVTVQDTTPPTLAPHANLTVPATNASGAAVNYAPPTASDIADANPTVACAPASGSTFPLGTTTVTCSATDAAGNSSSGSFAVTVAVGTPQISGAVAGKGRDAAGNFYVDVRLTNSGTGHARSLKINQIVLRTLAGSGTVSYLPALSGALPLSIGSLDVSASTTVRLFLSVPSTVTRFSITETGTLLNVVGTAYSVSTAQAVIP